MTELVNFRGWLFGLPPDAGYSFDIFDTTLTRIWRRPSDLFLVLGTIVEREAILSLSPAEFADARRSAELAARRSHPSGETTLEEIYARFGDARKLDPAITARLAEAEAALEAGSVRPISGMVALQRDLQGDNRRLFLTSDTYLPPDTLTSILTSAGVTASRASLFLSSEHRASKRNGDLYETLRSSHGGSSFVHIGDRKVADFANARKAGFESRLFAGQQESRYERHLGAARWSDPIAASAASGCARAARLQGAGLDVRLEVIRSVAADVAGPLLCAFVAWTLESAREAGVDRLLFLARDGQILQRLACRLAPAMGIDIDCRYSYASRQALYLPSVQEVGDVAWNWLCAHMEGRSAGQILRRFGLDDAASAEFFDRQGIDQSTLVDDALSSELAELLAGPELAPRILDIASQRRELVLAYFKGEFGSASRPAIVDVGWKGRLQVALQRILDAEPGGIEIDGYYFALDEAACSPTRGRQSAFFAFSKVPNTVLIETFTLADHGSVVGFRQGDGVAAEPVVAAAIDQASVDWGVREQQAAILDFADFFLDASKLGGFDVRQAFAELREPVLANFATFVKKPTISEASVYGDLEHSDDQAHNHASAIGGRLTSREVVLLATLGSTPLGRRVTYWPQASLRRFASTNPAGAVALRFIAEGRMAADRIRRLLRRIKRGMFRPAREPSKL